MGAKLTLEHLKRAKSLISGEGYFVKGVSASSPSTTEKTLTSLHAFSSTGWGMVPTSRESRLETTGGNLVWVSSLSSGKRQRMREIWGDYPLNSRVFDEALSQAKYSPSSSSTTAKSTGAQAMSLGVTSISTISSSPVKERLELPIAYRGSSHTDSIHSTDGLTRVPTDSLKHDCIGREWCWWCR